MHHKIAGRVIYPLLQILPPFSYCVVGIDILLRKQSYFRFAIMLCPSSGPVSVQNPVQLRYNNNRNVFYTKRQTLVSYSPFTMSRRYTLEMQIVFAAVKGCKIVSVAANLHFCGFEEHVTFSRLIVQSG